MKTEGKVFFFEKKKQKTFDRCRGPIPSAHLKTQKFFGSFFQKRTFLACLLVFAPTLAPAADDPVVAERAGDHITVSQARALLASLDPEARKKIETGAALSDLLRNLLLQRAVLEEAEAQKWPNRPDVVALLQRARDQLVSQSFLAAQAALPAGYPSETEIQAAYNQNKPKLMRPRSYQLSEIFLPGTTADQPSLRRRLADLARLAQHKRGGLAEAASVQNVKLADLGWIDETQLQPAVKAAVGGLQEGAISDPVCLPAGCHLLRLVATRQAGPAPLAQVRDALIKALRQQKQEMGERAYVNGLLVKQPVRINEIALSQVMK
jgi:peptidylprolyl isomerase